MSLTYNAGSTNKSLSLQRKRKKASARERDPASFRSVSWHHWVRTADVQKGLSLY